jgi:hypothetical protein
MIQFLGTDIAALGIVAEVNDVDCPAENDIHPFEPM